MAMKTRSVEVQNVYAVRVILSVLMGVAAGKSSYIDSFIFSLYNGKTNWNGDDSWTEHFCDQLNEIADEIRKGKYWKTGIFFTLIAVEDEKFWDTIGVPMKTWKSIELETNS